MEVFREWIIWAAAAVLGAAAAFLLFLRKVMTKTEHAQICKANGQLIEQKIETVKAELGGEIKGLKAIQTGQGKLLEKMDKKLDIVIRNGSRGP